MTETQTKSAVHAVPGYALAIHTSERMNPVTLSGFPEAVGNAFNSRSPGFRIFQILNSVRAAPLGTRRPCSQSWSVRSSMAKASANSRWLIFNRERINRGSISSGM